jgi:lipopolysaccharide export LptBFGC system permease protein LptF
MRELWGPFLFGVGLFSLLIISTAVMQEALRFVTRYSQPPSIFFMLVGYAMPRFVILSIPMGVLLGTLLSVGRLNTDNEIIAIRTCGISIYRLLAPYFIIGVLLSAVTFLGSEIIVPFCNNSISELKESIISGKRGLGQKLNYQQAFYSKQTHQFQLVLIDDEFGSRTLRDIARRLGLQAQTRAEPVLHNSSSDSTAPDSSYFDGGGSSGAADTDQLARPQRFHWPFYSQEQRLEWLLIAGEVKDNMLFDVTLFYFDAKDKSKSFMLQAENAVWSGTRWVFYEVDFFRVYRSESENEMLNAHVRVYQVPDFSIVPEALRRRLKTADDLNIVQLYQVIKGKLKEGLAANNPEILDYRTALHFKTSIPLTPLFFIIIALPMAIMPQRSSRAMSMGLALLTVLAYYSMYIICQKMGVAGILPPAVAAWVPNGILFVTGLVLLRLREQN